MKQQIRIGTRGSRLARCQTEWVIGEISGHYPQVQAEAVVITTSGDRNTSAPLAEIGGKGLFTQELEQALLSGRIDCAVHSLKDLPTEMPAGLAIGAIPRRATPLDALVPRDKSITSWQDLPSGAVLGTSSRRRAAQLRLRRPDLQVRDVRGNLDTRLRKLAEGQYDALVLAAAGLERLDSPAYRLPIPAVISLPAPGQGALAVEVREGDREMAEVCRTLEDMDTRLTVAAERAFLLGLGGGCQVPVGALAEIVGQTLKLQGIVVQPNGSRFLRDQAATALECGLSAARELGSKLAELLLSQGAKEILDCE
jgi:hydroxymethylbilane synthase